MPFTGTDSRPALYGRSLLPGPNTGFYEVLSASRGSTLASTTRFQWHRGTGNMRIVSCGWFAQSLSGGSGSTFQLSETSSPGAVAAGTAITVVLSIDGLTSATYLTDLDENRILGDADGTWIRATIQTGTNTIVGLTAWVLLHRTGHLHANPALD
jgi:hypothetical protein